MLRVERRLRLDAPAIAVEVTPPAPPKSPIVIEPSSFAPPIVAAPTVAPSAPANSADAPIIAPVLPSVPVSAPKSLPATAPAPIPIGEPVKAASSLLDWEQLVGGKWALWAGLLSVFGAIASFLAYTWRYFSPEAKVGLGLLVGVAFLVAGEWTRKRAQSWFSEGVSGAGLGFCFLSLWAGGAHFSIVGFGPTFGAMALVCALGVWLAVRYDALGLNILSVIGGFATPMLLRGDGAGGSNAAVSLLIYLAILNAGVLGVSLFKRWRASVWLSFGATLTLLFFWLPDSNFESLRLTVWAFFSLYFALYIGAACFYSLARREKTAPEDIGLIVAATTIYAPFAHDLLLPVAGNFPGAFTLGFALFWGALCALTARLAPANALLRDVTGALGILALTIAIPIQISQPWLGIALMGEVAVLAGLANRHRDAQLLRRAGQIVWTLALLPLVAGLISPAGHLRFGLHAGTWPLLFGVVVSAWLAWSAHCQSAQTDKFKADELADFYVSAAVAGGAWGLARELLARGFAPQSAIMAVGFLSVAVYILGAKTRFGAVQICALVLAVCAASAAIMLDFSQAVPALLPLGNARFVALIGTAGALYLLTWLVSQNPDELLRRAGQILWVLASLPLLQGLLYGAGEAQWGLHRGGWTGVFAVAATAALAWSAHRQNKNADEMRNVYAVVSVAGGAWLVARETMARTHDLNGALMALALYAVAIFAVGAAARFAALRACAGIGAASAAALVLWLAWSRPAPASLPFCNARFAAMMLSLGALLAIYQIARAIDFPLRRAEKAVARAFSLGAAALALAAFSTEIYFGFAHFAPAQWANRAGFALAIIWSLAALVALSVGLQARNFAWRVWAYLVGGVALASLPLNALGIGALGGAALGTPFFNARFAAFAVAIGASCVAARSLHKGKIAGTISDGEAEAIGAAASAALVLALFSLTQETWEAGRYLAPHGGDWQRGAQMAISLVWSLFGALLLAGGVQFRAQGARLGALALLAFTVCKVFLFDLSFLDGAGRALSLGGLGMALIFISWLYGRFGRVSVI